MTARYVRILVDDVPVNLRWDVPPQNQGQAIEVAYSEAWPGRSMAVDGAGYKRILNHGIAVGETGRTTFYKLIT